MIIDDDFVFIHNPHTAGSFLRSAFKKMFKNAYFAHTEAWHRPVQSLDKEHWAKFKLGVVRNPWDWYVSFYHHQLPNGAWVRRTHNGSDTYRSFDRFLSELLSDEFALKHKDEAFHPVGDPYSKERIPVCKYMHQTGIGFFTQRYVYMFCDQYDSIFASHDLASLSAEIDGLVSVDKIVKLENLTAEIIRAFNQQGIPLSSAQKQALKRTPKENSTGQDSRRACKRTHYRDYYDERLRDLVAQKDKLIIDRHNYTF